MQFSVYLYDTQTKPLKISNLAIELYDSSANTQLDVQTSGMIGTANEWGVILHWSPSLTNAVEILFNDPTCTYSGSAVVDINGALSGRLDVVLHALPRGPGGLGGGPSGSSMPKISRWIDKSPGWSPSEREAVRRLISNYATLILPRETSRKLTPEMQALAENWEAALSKVEVPLKLVRASKKRAEGGGEATAY